MMRCVERAVPACRCVLRNPAASGRGWWRFSGFLLRWVRQQLHDAEAVLQTLDGEGLFQYFPLLLLDEFLVSE